MTLSAYIRNFKKIYLQESYKIFQSLVHTFAVSEHLHATSIFSGHLAVLNKVPKVHTTRCQLKNGHPNAKMNFFCNKRHNLTTKFGVLWFLGIANLQKEFGDSISKIVDFFVMSNFCQSQFCFFSRVISSKSQTSEKNPQFLRQSHQIFFASCQYLKTQVYQI